MMKGHRRSRPRARALAVGIPIAAAVLCLLAGRTSPTRAQAARAPSADKDAIRPFRVHISDAALADLHRRLAATRWPDQETVGDLSQGEQLATMKEIARYWLKDYNWRKAEARLNALPQFVTQIDSVDIHFIHVRSRHQGAMPLLLTHGWPGSIFEFVNAVGPLTDPTAHGGRAEDAFDVVIPSLPGYGFSGKPRETGWDPERIARAWGQLMTRLGYRRYVAQGGDWGSPITMAMGRQAPAGLVGIHLTFPATLPPEILKSLAPGAPEPQGITEKERAALDALDKFRSKNSAYSAMMATKPQTIAYGLTDSPLGLAAFLYDYNGGEPERALSKEQMLDDVSLYWLTNSAASAARLYWENKGRNFVIASAQKTSEIVVPVAISIFPGELYPAPETWARRAYPKLISFHEVDKGGHFAAWEQPQLFAQEMRSAFRTLR
jgi:pimeloyl-ACP methyl ester carboxylesterase